MSFSPLARAQSDPQPDPNENCAPPGTQPAPTPFQPDNSLPLRTRKSAWDLTTSEVTRLNAAYEKLRALPPDDPRGWLGQAHVHCFNCSGSADYPSGMEIHGGWWFMPWHRAYLYFHERILASLVGDDTFALPYWDWDNTARQSFPQIYSVPGQATFDSNREAIPTSTPTLSDTFSEYQIDIPTILQDNDYELFMGNGTYPNGQAGGVENGPHGLVHLWTAQPSLQDMNGIIDMGVLQTAGRDPVFFCHHGNIDRLWWSWIGAGNANPSDNGWLGTTFNFYDENKQWTSMQISDTLDSESSLHYNYATSAIPTAAPVASKRVVLASAVEKTTTQGPDPSTKQIPLPAELRKQAPKTRAVPRRYILHIDGIDVPSDRSAIIRVFVNLPTATAATSAKTPNYVGFITIVAHTINPSTHAAHGSHKINHAFDITRQLGTVLKGAANLSVTLVPVAGLRDRPKDFTFAYDKVYLTEK